MAETCPHFEVDDRKENEENVKVEIPPDFVVNDLRIWEMTEILENTFHHLSLDSLKQCRLVCKIWNIEAVRLLQRRSNVCIEESCSEKIQEFTKLFEISLASHLPCPFKRFRVSAVKFSKDLTDLLSHPQVHVVTLLLDRSPGSNQSYFQKSLYEILTKNSNCLQLFRCALKGGIDLGLVQPKETGSDQRLPLRLPSLNDFGFWETDKLSKTSCINFLCDVINGAPNLTHLVTGSDDENVFNQILLRTDLNRIDNLYMENVTKGHIGALTDLKMPLLKTMTVQVNCLQLDVNRVSSSVLQNLVANFRETIENLTMTWVTNSPDRDFPFCSKLRTLSLDGWTGSLEIFNPERMPKLKNFLLQGNYDVMPTFSTQSHAHVTKFCFESTAQDLDEVDVDAQEMDQEYLALLDYVHRQFPHLKHLDLTLPISNELAIIIIQTFPHLERLILDTELSLSEHIFTGFNKRTLASYLTRQVNPVDAFRTTSFRDLKNLKIFVLARYDHSGMFFSNNAVKYGLGLMEELKVVQINWNDELSLDIVEESLGHLDRIIVNNTCTFEPFSTLNQLRSRMTQVELRSNHWDDD